MASSVSCKYGCFPFTYLGVPVGGRRIAGLHWNELISKVSGKLNCWKGRLLSSGGRLTLVKSVLNAIPTYLFSILKAPLNVIHNLEKISKRFLWGFSDDVRKTTWVSWKQVQCPKSFGGLGVGCLQSKNLSLLGKWFWRYKVEVNSLWRICIRDIYGENGGFGSNLSSRSFGSVWGGIVKACINSEKLDIPFLSLASRKINNGCGTSFWKTAWDNLPQPLANLFPRLFALESDEDCVVKDRWKSVNGTWSVCWEWTREPRGRALSDLSSLISMVSSLGALKVGEDRWIWKVDSASYDFYPCKKMQLTIQKMRMPSFHCNRAKFFWNTWIPIKVNMCMWRVWLNRLPTGDLLVSRGITSQHILCPLCDAHPESLNHILFMCSKVVGIWKKVWSWWKIKPVAHMDARLVASVNISSAMNAKGVKAFKGVEYITIWALWRWRNKFFFADDSQKGRFRSEDLFPAIQNLSFLWITSRCKNFKWTWESWISQPDAC